MRKRRASNSFDNRNENTKISVDRNINRQNSSGKDEIINNFMKKSKVNQRKNNNSKKRKRRKRRRRWKKMDKANNRVLFNSIKDNKIYKDNENNDNKENEKSYNMILCYNPVWSSDKNKEIKNNISNNQFYNRIIIKELINKEFNNE